VGHAANIGGRVVDRHAGTLSLAAGDVSDDGQTEYLWAPSFLVVGIPMRETPPRRLQTASVGWNLGLHGWSYV
jgi:hypothetical protein